MQNDAKKKPDEKSEEKATEPEKKQDDETPCEAEPPEDNSKEGDNPADNEGNNGEAEKEEKKPTDEPSDEKQGEENGEGADEPSADNPLAAPEKPATDSTNIELLNAKAQITAFKSGVRADVVEDAVCLAMHDAKRNGELTEESVAEALSGVLSRHPEWKAPAESINNFRVGADGSKENPSSNDEIAKIFGNK